MNLSQTRLSAPSSDVIPMINVAFLLLIFFLLMARIAPPDPIEISPPIADGAPVETGTEAFVDADGLVAFANLRGEAAVAALLEADGPILLRADADLSAAVFAGLLRRLATAGVSDLRLLTVAR